MKHSPSSTPSRLLAALLLLTLPALSGCLGTVERTEWAYRATDLDDAQGTGLGVRVAVLDTGVNVGHPSLDHLVDGDRANGELVAFRDFLGGREGVPAALDDAGHGSHVVGIMSARGGSGGSLLSGGFDLRGGAPGVELLVARVCDAATCDGNAIRRAVDWAVAQGAHVISMSLGGVSDTLPVGGEDDAIRASINAAIDRGVVVVAAAGNGGPGAAPEDRRDDVAFPADVPGVIAVGAMQRDGTVAPTSSRGDNPCLLLGQVGRCTDPDRKPELVAPGVGILSAWTGSSYVEASGTSQATPFVTSVVALMLEPGVAAQGRSPLRDRDDVADLKRALVDSAEPLDGQDLPHDDAAGYGLVQADAALRAYGVA